MRALLFLCLSSIVSAQDPKFLRDYALTRGFNLGRPARATPTPDGKSVLFLRATARDPAQSLYEFDLATGQARELLTPQALLKGAEEKLSAEEKARRERQRITARGFTWFQLSEDGKLLLVSLSGKLYTVARPSGEVRELPIQGAVVDAKFSPDAKHVSYIKERDLFVLDLPGLKERRLTRSDSPTLSNGVAEFVAQEEMDRSTGYWWSGDSKQIAYEQADARGVETMHVFDATHPENAGEPTFYPRPGKANVQVKLGVISVNGGATKWIAWDGEKYPYLTRVEWPKEGAAHTPLSFCVMSRDQQNLELFSVENGKAKSLLKEHDDNWLDLDPTLPRWLADGSAFLWSSEREAGWRLELRDKSGKLIRPLGEVADGYQSLVDLDSDKRIARFLGGPDPTETHLYEISLDGGPVRALTREPGQHFAEFGHDHRLWVDRMMTLQALARVVVHAPEGEKGELPSVAEAPPFMSKVELLRVGAEKFNASIIRPKNFDPKKKYPVLVQVYGGPHVVLVKKAPNLFGQWLADHGMIVVSFDGRGTPRRGRDWERAIRNDFGKTLDDQVTALRALGQSHPEMDLSRVGVTGWSFGGYLSALAVLKRPDVFHVGVAGAPVVDWHDYDTFYTERYLNLPAADADGYKTSSLLTYAASLSRPLLIIHGTSDDNVYFFHTMKLVDALFRAGKRFDLLPLAGFTHMVPDPVVTEQLWTRIVAHLTATLKP
jgi:dipeptidyl-peptidase-4